MLDNFVRRLGEFHEDCDLLSRLPGQFDAGHRSAMYSAHLHICSVSHAHHIVELRLQLVRGAKQILLAPDNEDPRSQNCQRHNDECSESCYSRHISPYDCFRNSFTNPMLLC